MTAYQELVRELLEWFEQVHVKLVPRNSNSQADALARLVTSEGPIEMKDMTITKLSHPSTSYSLVVALDPMDTVKENLMTLIIKHLKTDNLPKDIVKVCQLQMQATKYTIVENELYKIGFNIPLLKCITLE